MLAAFPLHNIKVEAGNKMEVGSFRFFLPYNYIYAPWLIRLFLSDGMCLLEEERRWRRMLGPGGAAATPERSHGSQLGQKSHNPPSPAMTSFIQLRSGRQKEKQTSEQVRGN